MNLAELLSPRDPDRLRIAHEVYRGRADLQQAFPTAESLDYLRWLCVNGPLEDDRVATWFPPVPPPELRATACGGMAPDGHLRTGLEDFRTIGELFEMFADREIGSLRSVLDFGCGCGRLLRWFGAALPDCELFGADVRQAAIDWCAAHLPGTYLGNGTAPPLELPDASVELTVALSVFSHLSRAAGQAWMRELARVTAPGGFVLVTTHGAFALALTARSAEHQAGLKIAADEVPELLRELCDTGFVHRVYRSSGIERGDGVADDYGDSFLTEPFARQDWVAAAADFGLDYAGCVPVALNLFQDVHVLRRCR
ncbi:MAG: class I SAM-dependent methyltransferase [bacterium]|nr:class I SAM-dependent methyltransferase [bacterium]